MHQTADEAYDIGSLSDYNLHMHAALETFRETMAHYGKKAMATMLEKDNSDKSMEVTPLERLLVMSELPCHGTGGMVKFCLWKNQEVPCEQVITKIQTDQGMCCAFNAMEAQKVYKKSSYVNYINTIRETNIDTPGTDKLTDTKLNMTTQSGRRNGLSVVLDAHLDTLIDASTQYDSYGFRAYVAPRFEFPWIRERGFIVRPGHVTDVKIRATKLTSARETVAAISPPDRNCYYEDEHELDLYVTYTRASCVYECAFGFAFANNNHTCLPWQLNHQRQNVRICDLAEQIAFMEVMANFLQNDECHHCLPDCETTLYTTFQDAARFR